MKNLFTILVLLSFSTCFSQAIFEKAPENAKEIHFVYEKKSKYILSKDGVYGDSIAFAIDFPAVKVTLRNHPTDTTKKSFFALYKNMNNDQERKLTAILYHTNEVYKGTHYIPSRVTVFYVTRYDEEIKNAFKKYLSEQYFKFEYRQEFNFNTRIEKRDFPSVSYKIKFEEIEKKLISLNDDYAEYSENIKDILYKNILKKNSNLSKYVTPYVFENLESGIEEIENINYIINLTSVTYK
jgi:hypothetical protein